MDRLDVDVERVALQLYEGLDSPTSLKLYLLVKHGEWDQVAACRADPTAYLDNVWGAEKFFRAHQACEFLRKYPDLPISGNKRKAAEDLFWAAEAQCKRTNDRLDKWLSLPVFDGREARIFEFIGAVKRLIGQILGPLPSSLEGKFGKGAVFESKGARRNFVLGDKVQLRPHTTRDCADLANHFVLGSNTAWGRCLCSVSPNLSSAEVVRGNRFSTVPKDATKDRGICIEPGLNVFLQLSVGSHIRRRLMQIANIDLDEGQSLHRRKAWWGSLSGELATIDLSSASDTVARKLVQLLLPNCWFELLNDLRSRCTEINGRWVYLEKFSSMGNGFTFELETLIFYAISKVASERTCSDPVWVYGDDIIVGRKAFDDVIAALRYFGFTPNPRKSFNTTPFRESCGGDFFAGQWVRPYSLDKVPNDAASWITVANGLWRASRLGANFRSIRRARLSALRNLPSNIRCLTGPCELGDVVVHDFPWRWRHVWAGWKRPRVLKSALIWQRRWFKCYMPVPKRVPLSVFPPEVQLVLALYGVPSSGLTPRVGNSDAVSGYRFGYLSFS